MAAEPLELHNLLHEKAAHSMVNPSVSRLTASNKSWAYIFIGLLLVGAWGLAYALRPTQIVDVNTVDLERQIPTAFGKWQELKTGMTQVSVAEEDLASIFWPYDKMLSRVYRRSDGEVVMLALAWGSKQRQDVKIHWPEVCYTAQGFRVLERSRGSILPIGTDSTIPVTRLVTQNASRYELVAYWVRIGQTISFNSTQSRIEILTEGLKGRVPDGILVRASQPLASASNTAGSFALQQAFLEELLASVDDKTRRLLAGV